MSQTYTLYVMVRVRVRVIIVLLVSVTYCLVSGLLFISETGPCPFQRPAALDGDPTLVVFLIYVKESKRFICNTLRPGVPSSRAISKAAMSALGCVLPRKSLAAISLQAF